MNHMIDSDTGHDPRSPMYKGADDGPSVKILSKYWDNDNREWVLDDEKVLENSAVDENLLIEFIEKIHGDNFDVNNITAIKKHADEIIINYWIQDNEVEKYELFYL